MNKMSPEFPEGLAYLIREKVIDIEYVEDWLKRATKAGTLKNLDYIECLNAIKKYKKHGNRKARKQSI